MLISKWCVGDKSHEKGSNKIHLFFQKRFIVPASDDQAQIPFARVNHNKYMVTDKVAYIGTSNWSGDYFIDTAGVGLVMADPAEKNQNTSRRTIRDDLASIFERDWNSKYARNLINIY